MMPVQSVESSPGHKVMTHSCEVCGGRADFGEGVSLRTALATGNRKHAGKWFCGWDREALLPLCKKINNAPGCAKGDGDGAE